MNKKLEYIKEGLKKDICNAHLSFEQKESSINATFNQINAEICKLEYEFAKLPDEIVIYHLEKRYKVERKSFNENENIKPLYIYNTNIVYGKYVIIFYEKIRDYVVNPDYYKEILYQDNEELKNNYNNYLKNKVEKEKEIEKLRLEEEVEQNKINANLI